VPFLVLAAGDPRYRLPRKASPADDLPFLPLEPLLDLLEPFAPPELAPRLAPLLKSQESAVRRHAALALAALGRRDCIEPVAEALADADPDDSVSTWALMGIEKGIRAGRAQPEFLAALFPGVAAVLDRPRPVGLDTAAECLLLMDREKASSILLSDRSLDAGNGRLHGNLKALNEARVLVPEARLAQLIKTLEPRAGKKGPDALSFGEVLLALAVRRSPLAEGAIARALKHENRGIHEAAAEALAVLNGIDDAHEFVLDRWEESGFEGLSAPQQAFLAVTFLTNDVNNGGFSQYFFNPSGDLSEEALAGLKALGATRTAEILAKARRVFGRKGPARDRDARVAELEALGDDEEKLGDLDDEFYEDPDRLRVLLHLYAVKHKEHFVAAVKPR
jgi:HEAT repeat protein